MDCLKDELEFNIAFAKVMLQETGHLSPMVIGFVGNKRLVFPFRHTNDEEKHSLAETIKDKLRKENATALVFMTEAWFAKVHTELFNESMRPSKLPNRQECLVVSLVNPKGSIMAHLPFIRIEDEIVFQDISIKTDGVDRLWGDMFK